MALAAGSHLVDRQKSARDLPLTARDRRIDQCLMPLLNFPLQLNFQFLLMLNVELRTMTFLFSKVQNCLVIFNFDAKMLILTPEILTDTLVLAAASASFLTFLLVSNHFQGYLKFGDLFFLFHQYPIIYFRY